MIQTLKRGQSTADMTGEIILPVPVPIVEECAADLERHGFRYACLLHLLHSLIDRRIATAEPDSVFGGFLIDLKHSADLCAHLSSPLVQTQLISP